MEFQYDKPAYLNRRGSEGASFAQVQVTNSISSYNHLRTDSALGGGRTDTGRILPITGSVNYSHRDWARSYI
jgi:hypothetical protein